MSAGYRMILCIIPLILATILVSCTNTIETPADELVASSWSTKLHNGTQIKLAFCEDDATLKMKFSSGESCVVSGFCELSDSVFIIHDESTQTKFAFSYIVHFDRVEVLYNENTVSLYKT